MGSVNVLTEKLPVIGLKLYLLISITAAVLLSAGVILLILFLRSRKTRQHSMRVDHLSSGLITKEIGEIVVEIKMKEEAGGGGDGTVVEEGGGSDGTAAAEAAGRSVRTRDPTGDKSMGNIGWGRWYTLRELEEATDGFSEENVIGEGGYGIVYRGVLPDRSTVAVKNLLNNKGQAEKEFKVEVEAIGKVRHKNLVGLIGYCAEGPKRMLVYEYIDNGNLEQWLHGDVGPVSPLTWDIRMKIAIGTAKGIAYLHEGLEPKVVHRDIKSSNILLDKQWNPKVSDFGLAKLLGTGSSFVTTRVMGTFGYVAPDYACTGMLNEGSDIYSFGVLLMELISGRSPVDYSRPPGEVNLVEWFKGMVVSKRGEEVVDPRIDYKPSSRSLKRVLLVCLRCLDLDAHNRPKMGQIAHMLDGDDLSFRAEHRSPQNAHLAPTSPLGIRRSPIQAQKDEADDPKRGAWR